MSTPKLRFKEFDGDWFLTSLNQLSTKIGDGIHATPKYDERGEIFFINGNNLVNGTIMTNDSTKRIESSEFGKYKQILSNKTLFLSINGTIGNLAFYNNEKILLGKSVCFINIDNKTDKFFIYFLLQSPQLIKIFTAELTGTTIKNLSLSTIRNSEFYCPLLSEQTKIASFLSSVDDKINQLTQKHQLLSQYKQGMLQKLFSQQLRFKADDGSTFGEWEETCFDKIGVFLKGKGISKIDIVDNGKTQCVRYGELYTHYNEVISNIISATNLDVSTLVLSIKNDVLIPASGETKIDIATASCIIHDGIALSGDLNIFRTKENGIFLSYLIRSKLKMKIAQLAQGNSVVHLYSSQLKCIQLKLPCLEEQTKIADFLTSLNQKIEGVAEQIKQAKTWKKGLLQQMFV